MGQPKYENGSLNSLVWNHYQTKAQWTENLRNWNQTLASDLTR